MAIPDEQFRELTEAEKAHLSPGIYLGRLEPRGKTFEFIPAEGFAVWE